MNRVKEVERINAKDLATQLSATTRGDAGTWDVSKSWHAAYSDSAYVYVGGLPHGLSEGDVSTVMAQWGEIVDVNMPRDKATGKPKGFAFICYEDQRSTILAVDNFNGAKLLGRTVRCDHCRDYREEQVKDPDAIPDHVARKLSDKELQKKRLEIAERNAELVQTTAEKEERFAEARGTAATPAEREEAAVRSQIVGHAEAAAAAKRTSHIEAVLAKRKAEHEAAAAADRRKQAEWEERRRKREREEQAGARRDLDKRSGRDEPQMPAPPPQGHVRGAADEGGPADLAFNRLVGSEGGERKKKHKKHREREAGAGLFKQPAAAAIRSAEGAAARGGGPPAERKRMGEDAASVDETNAMRQALGLKPLR